MLYTIFSPASRRAASLAIVTLAAAATAPAVNVVEDATQSFPTAIQYSEVVAGDFTGDSKDDYVAFGSGAWRLFVGNNDGTFTMGGVTTTANLPADSTAFDVDGDSDLDIVSVSFPNKMQIIRNAAGVFTPETTINVGASANAIKAANLDGDADTDLVLVFSGSVRAFLNDGTGVFTGATALSVANVGAYVGVGDVSGDSVPDVVVGVSSPSNQITVALGSGSGTFTAAPGFDTAAAAVIQDIDVADLDGDGIGDVAAGVNDPGTQLVILRSTGTALASLGAYASPFHSGINDLTLRDLDGDSDRDVVCNQGYSALVVGRNNGSGTMTWTRHLRGTTIRTAVGRFDAGALSDAVMVGFNQTIAHFVMDLATAPNFPNLIEDGTGSNGLAMTDVDADGDLDLLSPHDPGTDLVVYKNNGSGAFTNSGSYPLVTETFGSFAAGDIDGNARPDVASMSGISQILSVAFNTGSGAFNTPVTHTVGADSESLAIGDLDGDMHDEILVTDNTLETLTIWKYNGAGDVTIANTYTFATKEPQRVAIADMNADGKADVVVCFDGLNEVGILLGDGAGNLTLAGSYPFGSYDDGLALGDLTGDGIPDVVISRGNRDKIDVLLNNGTGVLGAATTYDVFTRAMNSVIVDMDGDGDKDVATAARDSASIALLMNNGSGTLSPALYYPGGNATQVAAGDLDGDGDPDLVGGLQYNGVASILLNTVPQVKAVDATGFLKLKVEFNEALTGLPASPANYTASGPGLGTLAANPTSVNILSPTEVELVWTSGEMQDGSDITVTVAGAPLDSAGNPLGHRKAATGVGTAVLPTSSATGPSGAITQVASTVNVTWNGSDSGSGVASVELFYRRNGGSYASYGSFAASPIVFDTATTGGDGTYDVYTEATDGAGNVEESSATPQATFTFNTAAAIRDWSMLD